MRLPRHVMVTTALCFIVSCSDGSSSSTPTGKPADTKSAKEATATAAPKTGEKVALTKPATPSKPARPQPPIEVYKPATPGGFHLDDGKVEYYRPDTSPRSPQRARRRIYINLASTPPGAIASIDGVRIGPTPTYWEGTVSGRPRDFTFVLPGYVMQRYRFVPVTNGWVHAPLKKVEKKEPAAGVVKPSATPATQ